MPLYDYECQCGNKEERFAHIEDKTLPCDKCDGEMRRLISSHFGICMGVGPYGYYDDNLQTYVRTNAHKREVMKQQGVTEKFGKGWR